MLKLEIDKVTKRFGDQAPPVVRGLSTRVAAGQMLVLLGPSGCGKTTTLRMVAGLLHPDDGAILIDGKEVAGAGWGWPPERRNLGMVFQSYAVWPHKTVFENVAYGLKLRRVDREALSRRVQRALDLVHLGELGGRYPSELSGGQQQRVALARAIVVEPSLLLLDEPLSNLDAVLREQMRVELKGLQRQLGLASIYVTHDQAEAMVLADHLVVMRDGVVDQEGSAEEVYSRPRSEFTAGFLGITNLLRGRVTDFGRDRARVEVEGLGPVSAFLAADVRGGLALGGQACISVRPMGATISTIAPIDGEANIFEGRIIQRIFLGELTEYSIASGNIEWKVHMRSAEPFALGHPVWVVFPPDAGTVVLKT